MGSTQCNPRQAIESVISSVRAAVDCDSKQSHLARKALIEPVRDTGHSEIIMHYQGTQLFEKGLGFPNRTVRGWEDLHLREQVRTGNLQFLVIQINVNAVHCFIVSNVHQHACIGNVCKDKP